LVFFHTGFFVESYHGQVGNNYDRLRTQGAKVALKLTAKANTIENKFRSSEAKTEEIKKETTTGYEF